MKMQSDSLSALLPAFKKMQGELPAIGKSKDAYKFKYAPYEAIWKAIRNIVGADGFVVTHRVEVEEITTMTANGPLSSERVQVLTMLIHAESGEYLASVYPIPPKSLLNAQDFGKEQTYGERYNLKALLGLAIEDEPDVDSPAPVSRPSKNSKKIAEEVAW